MIFEIPKDTEVLQIDITEVKKQIRAEAIDDLCNEISTYRMYDEYGNVIDLLEIAERLKEQNNDNK